jgi:uncharacterized membrane protein YvbJ
MVKFCPGCGQQIIDSNMLFCPHCGMSLPITSPLSQPDDNQEDIGVIKKYTSYLYRLSRKNR